MALRQAKLGRGGREVKDLETFRWNPVGKQSHPVERVARNAKRSDQRNMLTLDENHAFLESFLQLPAQGAEVIIGLLDRCCVHCQRRVLVPHH